MPWGLPESKICHEHFLEDNTNAYLVYSKGEKTGADNDEIIYISKILSKDNQLKIGDISDDNEWTTVQKLLKQIANAN